MKLVIVESPTKAKTINKYLGDEYTVKSSLGHVRDLPKKPGKKNTIEETMGIYPSDNWRADYEILKEKVKVVKELKTLTKEADEVYLASDPDREGEAIAWHLREVLQTNGKPFFRVSYQEITKTAVSQAFAHPDQINGPRVNAYKARRFLDRIVGFQLSPLLWKYVAFGLSAGRVQSVAVRLVVERELEIKSFVPEEYWGITANLSPENDREAVFPAETVRFRGEKLQLQKKADADSARDALEKAVYTVKDRSDKPASSKPFPPFITSTLQQAASVRLGYGVKRTMLLAQRLYENGYITYMRTDSVQLSKDALQDIRGYISSRYGKKYLPDSPRRYASSANAQEGHEAIRPSDISVQPESVKVKDDGAKKLYDLIWRQTVASQMTNAEFDTAAVLITAGDYELRAKGRTMKFDGWQAVIPSKKKDGENALLPPIQTGDTLSLHDLAPHQHFTKPRPRFTEASLVKELVKRGIGRPSTYAPIISTIQDRGYVLLKKKRFYAQKIGEIVTHQLLNTFPDLMDYAFTAHLEEELDQIAGDRLNWTEVLNNFYRDFRERMEAADSGKMVKVEPMQTEFTCEKCGRPMLLHINKSGAFLGCSGYKAKGKEKCKSTRNLVKIESTFKKTEGDNDEDGNAYELLEKHRCPQCGMAMDMFQLDEHIRLHVCGNSPLCDGFEIEHGTFELQSDYDGPPVYCDKCGTIMEKKDGRYGPYFSCTSEDCKNTRKILKSGEVAPPKADPIPLPDVTCEKCGSQMLLRDGARGIFQACSGFPKCRNVSSVPVTLLRSVKDQLDPKFLPLLQAPDHCPKCGQPSLIRWSTKHKHYLIACSAQKCKWSQPAAAPGDTEKSKPAAKD